MREGAGEDLEPHPDKTLAGRVARGFDFLGYHICTEGIVGVARSSMEGFHETSAPAL
jgi:hypothetical protein